MNLARRALLGMALKLGDLLIMVAAFTMASAYVADGIGFGDFMAIRIKVSNFVLFLFLTLLWYTIFSLHGMYRSGRLTPAAMVVKRTVGATSWGTLMLVNAAFVFNMRLVTPAFIAIFWMSATALNVANRMLMRWLLTRVRLSGHNLRNVLMIGTNPRARGYAAKIASRPDLGYRVLGFVDDEWSGIAEFRKTGNRLVTGPEKLIDFLRSNVVDEVVIALPVSSSYARASRIIAICEEQGIIVRFLTDLFDLKVAKATVEVFEDEPVVTFWSGTMEGWATLLKRVFDLVVSALLLVVLAPLLLATAVAIKLTSPGPVFFLQQRVGLNKRKFLVHKFRTMVVDAEKKLGEIAHLNEVSGPVFKIKNDPRMTPIGRFLRKTSIDELPQLIDVFLGNMSLVGPRPLPVRDYEGFDQDWHRRRFSVRPGITCLWQVNGRSSLPFEKWMELDMQYIDHWSLWLDLKILLQTIPAVLRGSGAA